MTQLEMASGHLVPLWDFGGLSWWDMIQEQKSQSPSLHLESPHCAPGTSVTGDGVQSGSSRGQRKGRMGQGMARAKDRGGWAGLPGWLLKLVLKGARGSFLIFLLPPSFRFFLHVSPSQSLICLPLLLICLFSLTSLSSWPSHSVLPTQSPGPWLFLLSSREERHQVSPHSPAGWLYGNGIPVSQFQCLPCALLRIWPEAWPVQPVGLG